MELVTVTLKITMLIAQWIFQLVILLNKCVLNVVFVQGWPPTHLPLLPHLLVRHASMSLIGSIQMDGHVWTIWHMVSPA